MYISLCERNEKKSRKILVDKYEMERTTLEQRGEDILYEKSFIFNILCQQQELPVSQIILHVRKKK